MANYILSVGMEVHAELLTESKMFCRCPVAFGGEPNTRVCPVCIGLPGALPKPNAQAIELVMRTSLALNCKIARNSVFHRKNYFYPDLPKAYQISQYGETNPIGYHGYLMIPAKNGGTKRIGIRRVHLEEDTGKLMHLPSGGSGIDFNRAGVPLMEIVTDFPPDITDPDEAKEYLNQLRQILVYLGVCNGKLEEGSMRCEPNISVRVEGAEKLGTKTELKNLNSFRSVQLGIDFERRRQIAVLESGGTVIQETRGWNDGTETSFSMRKKEEENDYRYFSDPDLAPMEFSDDFIERVRGTLVELPLAKLERYRTQYALSEYDANLLVSDQAWADFFEESVKLGASPKQACNLMNSDFAFMLKESGQTVDLKDQERELSKIKPAHIAELSQLLESQEATSKTAKVILEEMFKSGTMPRELLKSLGLEIIRDDNQVRVWAQEAIAKNPDPVAKYKAGQHQTIGFLVGQVMKMSGGKADPPSVQGILKELLSED